GVARRRPAARPEGVAREALIRGPAGDEERSPGMANGKPSPDSQSALTPHLVIQGAAAAIEFYKEVFGATEVRRMMVSPDSAYVRHAHLRIGASDLYLNDAVPGMGGNKPPPQLGGTAVVLHLRVEDVDAVFRRAVAAGARATLPPRATSCADRYARLPA